MIFPETAARCGRFSSALMGTPKLKGDGPEDHFQRRPALAACMGDPPLKRNPPVMNRAGFSFSRNYSC
jgi:hypothetical protein